MPNFDQYPLVLVVFTMGIPFRYPMPCDEALNLFIAAHPSIQVYSIERN